MASTNQFLADLEKKLRSADKLRSNLDAAVYKHAVLGLVFLKYVSDAFEIRHQEVEAILRDENADYYLDPTGYDSDEAYAEEIRAELEVRDYYEYFLGQFALAEGKKGGQYYTPKSIVNLIVEMLEPFKGRVYDPAMGKQIKIGNAETRRAQSFCPSISSALSASPRFKSFRSEVNCE